MTELLTSKIGEVLASIQKEGPLDATASAGKDSMPGAESAYKGSAPCIPPFGCLFLYQRAKEGWRQGFLLQAQGNTA